MKKIFILFSLVTLSFAVQAQQPQDPVIIDTIHHVMKVAIISGDGVPEAATFVKNVVNVRYYSIDQNGVETSVILKRAQGLNGTLYPIPTVNPYIETVSGKVYIQSLFLAMIRQKVFDL